MLLCGLRSCGDSETLGGLTSPPYGSKMAFFPKGLPSKKDHELFLRPKKRNKTPFTRSRNRSYQQATSGSGSGGTSGMEDPGKGKAVSDFIPQDLFDKGDQNQKLSSIITSLNKLHTKLDNINNDLYRDKEGLWPRLETVEETMESAQDSSEAVKFEVAVLKNVVSKQERQIEQLLDKVDDLTARQMSDNITISGLDNPIIDQDEEQEEQDDQDPRVGPRPKAKKVENCLNTVSTFLTEMLELQFSEDDILDAHRVGTSDGSYQRLMVVRCVPRLKKSILANSNKLAKKTNSAGKAIYINQQMPEVQVANRKEISKNIKEIRSNNSGKPIKLRTQYYIKNRKLHVDGYPVEKNVLPPTVEELLPDEQEQEKMEKIKLWYSEPRQEKGNVFIAIATKVSSVVEVKRAYRRVRQMYPSASHVALGYDCNHVKGNQDDREHAAGLCIQQTIEDANISNRAIFVVRNASPHKIGAKRFKIIADVTTEVITKIK